MKAEFWHERWKNNDIAFHEEKPNELLTQYYQRLNLKTGARIFLPLCGKTHDIAWLLSKKFRIVGIELSELAIQQLFNELKVEPKITQLNTLKRYSVTGLDIFNGDIFDLSHIQLGIVDAVYDRAALVALPNDMRLRYSEHLKIITNHASQLLITFEYDQKKMQGPPFSINKDEIDKHYSQGYSITRLKTLEVKNFKNTVDALEHAWLLEKGI